ncbi:MAG: HAMP domain-containing sensor histidine kinase [Ignavibacteriales bacterium]|nr:HAMP domain-containing sensor histidine kinase [Ignavibacteriales bacterium]
MKLINKISYRLLINSFIMLVILAFFSFFLIDYILESEINDQLITTRNILVKNQLIQKQLVLSPIISIEKVNEGINNDVYKDTLIYDSNEHENEEFRELISYVKSSDGIFKIIVRSSLIEKEDLLLTILIIFLSVYLLFVVSLFVINKRSANKTLKPFYNALERIRSFSLSEKKLFTSEKSKIDEFNFLNEILQNLTEKIIKEYLQVKEFTDNASHEIQTPLAVIKSKLDLFIQKENLNEEQIELFRSIYNNVNKLIRLNKSLLLLTKIEGNQFSESTEIDLRKILEKEVEEIVELAQLNSITIEKEIISSPVISANEPLIVILIKNILTNSIKHNVKPGRIKLCLKENILFLENTGAELKENPERLFERFYKRVDSTESVGLGLAIVKQICLLYNFDISYKYRNGWHSISIQFIK